MKLSEIKALLPETKELRFQLEDGSLVPIHFHVTEVGIISKHFIDCGGTVRKERVANFQLWSAEDHDHRLAPKKLLGIIQLSEEKLEMPDLEIEVEYQAGTIGKFGLMHNGENFVLTNKMTDCLAKDGCGVPELVQLNTVSASSCTPGGGCC